jgi:hypothetical protein
MTSAVARHFDVLDYADKFRALGADENLAKYQGRQIEQAIKIVINFSRKEIKK